MLSARVKRAGSVIKQVTNAIEEVGLSTEVAVLFPEDGDTTNDASTHRDIKTPGSTKKGPSPASSTRKKRPSSAIVTGVPITQNSLAWRTFLDTNRPQIRSDLLRRGGAGAQITGKDVLKEAAGQWKRMSNHEKAQYKKQSSTSDEETETSVTILFLFFKWICTNL